MVWMDLEMTGLDHTSDVIVEIATLITDDDLVIIAEGPDLVIHQDDDVLARMDPVVVEMHTRSGLLVAIRESTVSLDEAGAATLEFIKTHVPEPRSVPLCGNSIGTDRRFLAAYLPAIEDHLHYRSIDVSTVKELCRRWYPAAYAAAPEKAGGHRALDDIRESVAELQLYRDLVFAAPDIVAQRMRPPSRPGSRSNGSDMVTPCGASETRPSSKPAIRSRMSAGPAGRGKRALITTMVWAAPSV